jgi:hypothetical protein
MHSSEPIPSLSFLKQQCGAMITSQRDFDPTYVPHLLKARFYPHGTVRGISDLNLDCQVITENQVRPLRRTMYGNSRQGEQLGVERQRRTSS